MKKFDGNGVADSGAATANLERIKSQLSRLLTVDELDGQLQAQPRTNCHLVHERFMPSIKLRAQIRFDQVSVATWVRKREPAGRIYRPLVIVAKVEAR